MLKGREGTMYTDIIRTLETVSKVSDELEYIFTPEEVRETYHHTIRKCELNGKDEEYFSILLDNELRDLLMRRAINRLGAANRKERYA